MQIHVHIKFVHYPLIHVIHDGEYRNCHTRISCDLAVSSSETGILHLLS